MNGACIFKGPNKADVPYIICTVIIYTIIPQK
jgi:hypothetical protein